MCFFFFLALKIPIEKSSTLPYVGGQLDMGEKYPLLLLCFNMWAKGKKSQIELKICLIAILLENMYALNHITEFLMLLKTDTNSTIWIALHFHPRTIFPFRINTSRVETSAAPSWARELFFQAAACIGLQTNTEWMQRRKPNTQQA